MATIRMNHEFSVLMPDMNGEEDGATEGIVMPAGEYEVIGHTRTCLVITDGDLEAGEGTNWLLHPVQVSQDKDQ